MPFRTLFSLAFLGLVAGVFSARFHIEPDKEYFILDSKNNSLTLTDRLVNAHVITSQFKGLMEQKWVFKVSGDIKPTDNRYVIRPTGAPDKLTVDSDKMNDRWYAKLLDWRNSRLWIVREIGNDQVEIINNKDSLCLRTEGLGENVGLGHCDAGEPTWWTIVPVEQPSKLPGAPTYGVTSAPGSGESSSTSQTSEAPSTEAAKE